nr:hypothetical protein GCM10020241_13380 [Streptoalloteichus tenebrarius]
MPPSGPLPRPDAAAGHDHNPSERRVTNMVTVGRSPNQWGTDRAIVTYGANAPLPHLVQWRALSTN